MYFELELGPNGDLYKGEVQADGTLSGPALYLNRKSKLLICGVFGAEGFSGCCLAHDMASDVAYQGQMKNSMKHGSGVLKKMSPSTLLDQVNNRTYKSLIAQAIEQAELECERAKAKVRKAQALFTASTLKEVLRAYTPKTKTKKSDYIYVGEFQEDKRHGWGSFLLKTDRYRGQFERDLMHGRGVYKFAAQSPAAFFIGELKEN